MIRKEIQVILSVIVLVVTASGEDVSVWTQQGTLRGIILTSPRSNREFFAFMGIPYAKPPVGDLRFKPPQPADSWSGVKNAVIEGAVCPQVNEFTRNNEGEEDCLFLNVYSPKLPSGQNDTLLPVMVSIHGGAFSLGSGNRDIQGPDYLVDEGVVVVTINYRLGILGFLSLQNADIPGNAGLKDQILALKWVQENIAQFGGDPETVTIFGVSAGAACTHLHMMSRMSEGLFHRAISQSGSAFMPWSVHSPEQSLQTAMEAAEILGINNTSTEIIAQALKNYSLDDLWPVIRAMSSFRPTVEVIANNSQIFLPALPKAIMNIRDVPYIAGVNSNEGILLLDVLKRRPDEFVQSELTTRVCTDMGLELNSETYREVTSKLKQFYYGNPSTSNATLQQSMNLISDMVFVNGIYCAAKKHAAAVLNSPTYMYEFAFSGNMSVFKIFYGGEDLEGASHADDLAHIYRTTFHNHSFIPHSREYVTSVRLTKMWSNFAKTGNPTPEPDSLFQNVTWTPITGDEFAFLKIDDDLAMQHILRNGSVMFWEELYTNYSSNSLCETNV